MNITDSIAATGIVRNKMFYLAAFLFIIFGFKAGAQPSTSVITTQVIIAPNPPSSLSDWQSAPQTVQLTANLNQAISEPVKLMMQLTLNGEIAARTKSQKLESITLHQGTNAFNASTIVPYSAVDFVGGIDESSKRIGRLPEGNYQLCVWFIDAQSGRNLGGSNCCTFAIRDIVPPVLLTPTNGATINTPLIKNTATTLNTGSANQLTITDLAAMNSNDLQKMHQFDLVSSGRRLHYTLDQNFTPMTLQASSTDTALLSNHIIRFRRQAVDNSTAIEVTENSTPINFSWLPPTPMPMNAPRYELKIYPIYPNQTPQQSIQSGRPIVDRRDLLSTIWIGDASAVAALKERGSFVWSVRATDAQGNGIGKNNGWSEPFRFEIGDGTTLVDSPKTFQPDSFFDVFFQLEQMAPNQVKPIPCPYQTKTFLRNIVTPCENGRQKKFDVYRIFTCSMSKGHSGEHHGTVRIVYVYQGSQSCKKGGSLPKGTTEEAQPGNDSIIPKKDIEKIPNEDKVEIPSGNTIIDATTVGQSGNILNNQTEPCPYQYKRLKRKFYTPCVNGLRKYYAVYGVFHCSLQKGHSGPHHGTLSDTYVLLGEGSCNEDSGTGGNPTEAQPPAGSTAKPKEIDKIPTREEADEADGKILCPYTEKQLLRTVAGTWRKVKTEVSSLSLGTHTTAYATVSWERDIWNVYLETHCTLELGHGGAHHLDAGHEIYVKYVTHHEDVVYGVGESQTAPSPGFGDELPQEDPK